MAAIAALAVLVSPAGLFATRASESATTPPSTGSTTTTPPTSHKTYSIKDSPGYVPLVDPESTSVLLGRRPNAPIVSAKFKGGGRSLDDLGRRVLAGINHDSRDSLWNLCVSREEFRDILWNEFPQSRPVTGLTWEDGWKTVWMRVVNGCSGAVRDYNGPLWTLVSVEADSVMQYKNFKMYSRMRLVARNDEDKVETMYWLRAVVERKGSFKIFSTDD